MCDHVLHQFISAIKCLKVNDKLYFLKHIFTETADFLLNSIMKLQVCVSKHAVNPMNQL